MQWPETNFDELMEEVQHMLDVPLKDQSHLALDKRINGKKSLPKEHIKTPKYLVSAQVRNQLAVKICKGDDGPGRG